MARIYLLDNGFLVLVFLYLSPLAKTIPCHTESKTLHAPVVGRRCSFLFVSYGGGHAEAMECLQVGYQAESNDLSEIKSQWIRFNHTQSKAVKAMTVDKRGGIYKSVCACAPMKNLNEWRQNTVCQAHLFVYKNAVVSVELEHQCSSEDPGRKRQYNVALLTLASEQIRDYTGPTNERGRSVQEYADTARAAGFEVGKTQAYKVLQKINQDPIETHLGQYFLLTSMIKAWKRSDPKGSYELETSPTTWNDDLDAFERIYAVPAFAKHAWKHCKMRFLILNASFRTGGHFGHTVLLAVTYDANDEVILLATALCEAESQSNWSWFVQNLIRDFPGIQLVLSSSKHVMENEELETVLNLISAKRCWCIRRLMGECPEKLTKEDQTSVMKLAKACTVQLYNAYLQAFQKSNTSVATWFDNRKHLFASHFFLEANKTRFGRVQDGTADEIIIQEIMEIIDGQPIATLLATLMAQWFRIHEQRKELAQSQAGNPNDLSPQVLQSFQRVINEARNYHIQPIFNRAGQWKAYVSYSQEDHPLHRMLVTFNQDSYTMRCPCQQSQELGSTCVHATAVILAKDLGVDHAKWFHPRYHAATQRAIYDFRPEPNFVVHGKLKVVELAPPPQSRSSTARSKKRNYTPTKNTETARVCRACGEKGHHHKTCQNPSTQYQYERFSEKAKKWAREQRDIKVVSPSSGHNGSLTI